MTQTTYQQRVKNIYPDAYIANKPLGKGIDQFYITTPELHAKGKILGEYKSYRSAAWESADLAMKVKFSQLTQFNVTEALAGKPIITRLGISVTGFRKRDNYMALPYECVINGKTHYYCKNGKFISDSIHRFDLFMK